VSNRTGDDPFSTFAAELSHNLPLITRLLAAHPAAGRCTGCRSATGRPPIMAPCSIRTAALLALRIRADVEQQGAS
jgi:hypothetical protein